MSPVEMPYRLVKATGGNYFVENKETGRRYSQEPIPLEKAKAQMRVLYYSESRPNTDRKSR